MNTTINNQKIAIIGLGYVGLPLALLADQKKYDVIGIDVDTQKIDLINNKKSPIQDKEIQQHISTATILATNDFSLVRDVSTIVVCVPTPVDEGHMPDLTLVTNACAAIAPYLQKGQLIILESTVNPGVSRTVVLPVLEKNSQLTGGKDFYLAHCPERINPGDMQWGVENINRVVGALTPEGLTKAVDFYTSLLTGQIKPMGSIEEAEAVKVVENSFRDINIAFVNELAMSFSHLHIDVVNVIEGAATKPFAFMAHFPGCGVGGHCIPVDPYYLIEYAKSHGFEHDFLRLARRINNKMPEFTAQQVLHAMNEKQIALGGATVAVLGLAYKPNIDDYRESPSFEIIKHLQQYGAHVETFDPFVPKHSTVQSLEQALEHADAIVIATGHDEFTSLSVELLENHNIQVVVDGRNCLDKTVFENSKIMYRGIGR